MGNDLKYGKVTLERKAVPEDEPLLIFRAQDVFAPKVGEAYLSILEKNGLGKTPLADIMRQGIDRMRAWQRDHPDRVKTPD